MTEPDAPAPPQRGWLVYLLAGAVAVVLALGLALGDLLFSARPTSRHAPAPRKIASGGALTVWWDQVPAQVGARPAITSRESNIHPADYVGPETCQRCHPRNHASWAQHPHRWMNALANEANVRGDYNGTALNYRGGRATFARADGEYRMRLERGALRRVYAVTQTIGSRFFQYYVGRQVEGPEATDHPFYREEHVLPFGYWLAEREWVPVVHIGPEVADEQRPDPFAPPERGVYYAEYAASCNYCHTTFPLGDLFARRTQQIGGHAPQALHWALRPYLEDARPQQAPAIAAAVARHATANPLLGWTASEHAVTLGISCEACHLGGRAHVASGGRVLPKFFPVSPHLAVANGADPVEYGRTPANINWACGRCHTGTRPQFAAGMSTWNSVEYDDARRGSCYSQLTCIDCHNPHRAIGTQWSLAPAADDALCLKCHEALRPAPARAQHTHHAAGSTGARCMNCHMPRINEGLEGLVRTHMIYAPTRADMIEANQPNACNLCHTDRPIDWTLQTLQEWYGAKYNEAKIAAHYPRRADPVAVGWLASTNPAVRLVACDALCRTQRREALPELLAALDDSHLVNRQFAARGLRDQLQIPVHGSGYRFYQTAAERRVPLAALRDQYLAVGALRP